jgi:transcriptional antiterminator NusG
MTKNNEKAKTTKEQEDIKEDIDKDKPKTEKQAGLRGWYVIHTYTGFEDQVADSLKQRIESLDMQDKIFDVIVPIEKQIEIKNGKRQIVERKIFPGYVMVDMIVTDDSWYVVRNTPNVTGFIGLGVRPTPMSPQEVERIKKRMGVEEPKYKIELKVDDLVRINDGPLKGFEAKVTEIDDDKGKIKVLMSMFGRETPVTLDFLQVKKI